MNKNTHTHNNTEIMVVQVKMLLPPVRLIRQIKLTILTMIIWENLLLPMTRLV